MFPISYRLTFIFDQSDCFKKDFYYKVALIFSKEFEAIRMECDVINFMTFDCKQNQ